MQSEFCPYFLNEHLCYLSPEQVYLWDQNLSSHWDIQQYRHRILDLPRHNTSGPIETEARYLPDKVFHLPAPMAPLPPRLPRQIWIQPEAGILWWDYLQQAPRTVLRKLNFRTVHLEQEWSLPGLNPWAPDEIGKGFFGTDYPRNQTGLLQNLDAECFASATWSWPEAEFVPGAIWAQGLCWLRLKKGRRYYLLGLSPKKKAPVHELALPARPSDMSATLSRDSLVMGCGTQTLIQVDTQTGTVKNWRYPGSRVRDNALCCKLSPQGRFLAVYGSLEQTLRVLELSPQAEPREIYQQPLRVQARAPIWRRPDFLPLDDRLLCLQDGRVTQLAWPV